jgi:hypothetical protein
MHSGVTRSIDLGPIAEAAQRTLILRLGTPLSSSPDIRIRRHPFKQTTGFFMRLLITNKAKPKKVLLDEWFYNYV